MMEFYRNLRAGLTKAEAVRNTQRAMLDEQRVAQDLKELRLVISAMLTNDRRFETLTEAESARLRELLDQLQPDEQAVRPDEQLEDLAEKFTHPYYWSAYTLVGSPW